MKHIVSYGIFEIRGYMVELESAAQDILDRISSGEKSFGMRIETPRGGFHVDVESLERNEYRKKYGKSNGICITVTSKNFVTRPTPKIVINSSKATVSTVIHELKHAFNYSFGGSRQLKINHIINDLSDAVGETYDQYFKVSPQYVSMVLYLLNREELEAWYHSYAHDIRNATVFDGNVSRPMNSQEKKTYIDGLLKSDIVISSLQKWKDGGFNFSNLFRSEDRMVMFFNRFLSNSHQKSKSVLGRFLDVFSIFLSGFRKGKNDYSSAVKSINDEINRNCETYWKKYKRLYTL